MDKYHYFPGTVPVLVSIPHVGTYVPGDILERFTSDAKHLPDTDWHVDRLYDFCRAMGIHMLVATHSRYVVDLNRAPDDQSLYPGRFTTGLCPTTLFNGEPLYQVGAEPDAAEIQQRVADYWEPYHHQLQSILSQLQQASGQVVLLDAHSICSHVPTLFDGTLPDLNLGTAGGASASADLAQKLFDIAQTSGYSSVHNGRFKGGYITRHYGLPGKGVHAVQLELAQVNYMDEFFPYTYDEHKARKLQQVLTTMIATIKQWVSSG